MSRPAFPDPPSELKQLSATLCERLRADYAAQGFVPFERYMERVLYEPGLGYYSAGLHKFGAGGDFVTAPELGTLYADCLAAQIAEAFTGFGPYEILELGAGSGRLAADVLTSLNRQGPAPSSYRILERSGDLRAVQRQTIEARAPALISAVEWIDAPPDQPWSGIMLANEVVDALAVERFRCAEGRVEQVGVRPAGEGFEWDYRPAPQPLERAVRALGVDLPEPYESEILPNLAPWLASVTGSLASGIALFVDYGYPRAEYYLAERRQGTLMCHYRHRAHGNPFLWPGLQDLTAFVDFTALAEAGQGCGLELAGYTSQALFLLGCGLDRILADRAGADGAETPALAAEAKQLTLPGMMGERFQVMAFSRKLDRALSGFSLRDLRYRL